MTTWTVPGYTDAWTVPGYTEERQLGKGASGRVVAAVSDETGRRVAIKYLSRALTGDPVFLWRFRSEAELQRSLDVPQVVRVFDYVEEPGRGAAIVMELIDGVSLHEMIGQRGPASPEAALTVLKGSLLGLAAAHAAGVVHRDYKPENVLVDAEGSSKLADFGVAVKTGKKLPTAGTPLYMAPEQWNGAPSSPATDIYAAAAVFFECLTGKTPFSGRLPQLRRQHETAAVPLDEIGAPPLRSLVLRGMAKDPADRPQDAMAFVSELEAVATAEYGPEWEERGRSQLAERVAALLVLLLPLLLGGGSTAGSSATSVANTELGGRPALLRKIPFRRKTLRAGGHKVARRKAVAAASIATAAIAVAATASAVALTAKQTPTAQLSGDNSSVASTTLPTVQATVTPPVAASQCTAPASFTFRGTVTATAPGTVSYRWAYSDGQQGPVQTLNFAAAGHRDVTGATVKTAAAGAGWGEITMLSPAAGTSNKATYKLLCGANSGGISAAAAMQTATQTVTCGSPIPAFTATGSITSHKAGKVSYYWALADGRATPPATVTFTAPGTQPAETLTLTPLGEPASGEAVLVVTSPVAAASAPAPYTLSCTEPVQLAASAAVSPASETLSSCTAAAPALTFTGTISDNQAGTVSYYWALPDGNGPAQTLTFAQAGTQTVTDTYHPSSDRTSGSGSLVVTSPGSAASNAAYFALKCTKSSTASPLSMDASVPTAVTAGQAYSGTVTVTGGVSPYTWAAATGLPPGLTATANGATLTISGTPTASGRFTVGVSVSDSSTPAKLTRTLSMTVTVSAPLLTLTANAADTATEGQAYTATFTAAGGAAPYTWGAVTGLPSGLTATANGATLTISGTPAAETADGYAVGVSVTDGESPAKTATASLSLTVNAPAAPPLTIGTAALSPGTWGAAYSATVSASGGTGAYKWSATGLPSGLAINSATGAITGTPFLGGALGYPLTDSVTVTVTDSGSPAQTATRTLSLTVGPQPVRLTGGTLAPATSGAAYSASAGGNVTGGAGPYHWSATGLPPGLAINSATGAITGTPAGVKAATSYTVTVTVGDGESPAQTASAAFGITVNPAPVVIG